MQKCVGQMKWLNDSVVASKAYCALGCDISDIPSLKSNLRVAGVDYNYPTLFISECVLTYVNAER